ncbi:MAG: L-seryl-tRNA(Sec) selenium transferase [bacterium]
MKPEIQNRLSKIPPVNQVLEQDEIKSLTSKYSHRLIHSVTQQQLEKYKSEILKNPQTDKSRDAMLQEVVGRIAAYLTEMFQTRLKRVINATGIILHTGLGRAPLSEQVKEDLLRVAEGYCALELDLATGKRGNRTAHVEDLLCELTGAEAACVVNNNAAAVLITLNTLSFGKEAVVSRGQLIEIGGSFRIPEVMEKSGAIMKEVGTTNKTHLKDYAKVLSAQTGLISAIHPSNYRVQGFTQDVELSDLVKLGEKHGVPVFHDLGGGVLVDLQKYGLPYEPIVWESVEKGIDIITFSGDKVLGGPQCGLIVGKRKYIEAIKSNPLMRALRCDKLIFAALESTLKLYFNEEKLLSLNKVLAMLTEKKSRLNKRAQNVLKSLSTKIDHQYQVKLEESVIQIGSGAMPLEEIPSQAVSIQSTTTPVDRLAKLFRLHDPPIIGYIRENKLYFDFRTVLPSEDKLLVTAMNQILSK